MELSKVARLACLLVLASRCTVSFGLQGKTLYPWALHLRDEPLWLLVARNVF